MRKELEARINELKKQTLQARQQSIKIMQESARSLFKQASQESDAITTGAPVAPASKGDAQWQTQHDMALQAMQNAQHAVNKAVNAANHSLKEAEKVLKKIE